MKHPAASAAVPPLDNRLLPVKAQDCYFFKCRITVSLSLLFAGIRAGLKDPAIFYTFAKKHSMKDLLKLTIACMAIASASCNNQQETAGTAPVDPVEAETKAYRGYEIKETDASEQAYIMKRKELSFAQIAPFYAENLPGIFEAVGKQGLQPQGSPSGLFFTFDEANMRTDMAAAIPVAGNESTVVEGYETFVAPAGKMLVVDYYGAYDKSAEAHRAIDDYMKEKNLAIAAPVVEEYVTDPSTEPDTAKWLTRIYYRVK